MFCEKCGIQLENNDLFCPNCIEKTTNYNTSTKQSGKFKLKRCSFIVVGLLIIIILTISLSSSNGYKKTIDNYFKAYATNNPDLMYESVISQCWIDYMNECWGNSAFETIKEDIEDDIEEWDCGDNIKITYEIKTKQRATNEQLEELEENIFDWRAKYVYERDEFKISDAYVLDISFTVKGDEGIKEYYFPDGVLIIKENGKWKMSRGPIDCSFYDNHY